MNTKIENGIPPWINKETGNGGIACPGCGNQRTSIIDSRNASRDNSVRRRRVCLGCGARFTTKEHVVGVERGGVLECVGWERSAD